MHSRNLNPRRLRLFHHHHHHHHLCWPYQRFLREPLRYLRRRHRRRLRHQYPNIRRRRRLQLWSLKIQ